MSRTTAPEFAAALPVKADDPYHRIQIHAEKRARRNGYDEDAAHEAGRKAMALRKMMIALGIEPNPELILQTVAGDFLRT